MRRKRRNGGREIEKRSRRERRGRVCKRVVNGVGGKAKEGGLGDGGRDDVGRKVKVKGRKTKRARRLVR
jgi:hypothetical protein